MSQKKPKSIKLGPYERIVAVVPERCSGPGWSNSPTWVYIANNDGRFRSECIQPEERSLSLSALFDIGAVTQAALKGCVPFSRIVDHK